ncbi:MAG: alanine:cation symporter family protein [Spirulinaceae cyanobacterium SM2_1_0]|nr:alanine:cation symporter family protein [Spirulinaceae cyanobacterium SM2_1_0]
MRNMKRRTWLYVLLFLVIPTVAIAQDEASASGGSFLEGINASFAWFVNNIIFGILFFDAGTGFPFIVLWLIAGAIFFTFRMQFVNIRAFKHAIDVVRGKYDDPEEEGEVSHFQALATALSATVGLGNIAGVAIAVSVGGPGAVLWMTVGGIFGMTSKFVECTLGQKYRVVKPDGTVSGGPMRYLSRGLAELGQRKLGQVLAAVFSVLCIFGAFGGANMFQANQSYGAVAQIVPIPGWLYGVILATLVGLVIIGGVERIGQVAGAIVPLMCTFYVLASLFIILTNMAQIPNAISVIISGAFNPQAIEGGILGVIVQGLRRSAFSNEAGIGSAAIAHSAARTEEPIREGIVALLEPFIDTIVVCNMTALVLVITGAYNDPAYEDLRASGAGAELTSAAFGSAISWFPVLLAIAVFLFAFSTMISWGYYGERCWDYLSGGRGLIIYKILFLLATFIGSIAAPGPVIDFSDGMLLAMALPNLLGAYFLSNIVARDLKSYLSRLKSGEMVPVQ